MMTTGPAAPPRPIAHSRVAWPRRLGWRRRDRQRGLAYERFRELFSSERFAALSEYGARVQRQLWAPTGAEDERYRDVMYVEQLAGPGPGNTMPLATPEALVDHGPGARRADRQRGRGGADAGRGARRRVDLDASCWRASTAGAGSPRL